jgi:hypothetical protein
MPYFKDFRGWTNLPPPYYKVFTVVDVIICYCYRVIVVVGTVLLDQVHLSTQMSRRNASEFADETEWYQYHQPLLTGTQTIAAILVKHQPASVWQVISTWTQTCLQSAIQQAQAAAASSSM